MAYQGFMWLPFRCTSTAVRTRLYSGALKSHASMSSLLLPNAQALARNNWRHIFCSSILQWHFVFFIRVPFLHGSKGRGFISSPASYLFNFARVDYCHRITSDVKVVDMTWPWFALYFEWPDVHIVSHWLPRSDRILRNARFPFFWCARRFPPCFSLLFGSDLGDPAFGIISSRCLSHPGLGYVRPYNVSR
jgi:hypothetical protein